jgi:hypothetical protein
LKRSAAGVDEDGKRAVSRCFVGIDVDAVLVFLDRVFRGKVQDVVFRQGVRDFIGIGRIELRLGVGFDIDRVARVVGCDVGLRKVFFGDPRKNSAAACKEAQGGGEGKTTGSVEH